VPPRLNKGMTIMTNEIQALSDDELNEVAGGYEPLGQLINNIKYYEATHPAYHDPVGAAMSAINSVKNFNARIAYLAGLMHR
jgi:hypothetical protein